MLLSYFVDKFFKNLFAVDSRVKFGLFFFAFFFYFSFWSDYVTFFLQLSGFLIVSPVLA